MCVDFGNRCRQIPGNLPICQADHTIAPDPELEGLAPVGPPLFRLCVVSPVDLDHQSGLGYQDVNDGVADDLLDQEP